MKPSITRRAFLHAVWNAHPGGVWLFLAARKGRRWIEHPIKNDSHLEVHIRAFLKKYPARSYDLYFCPNAFSTPTRKETKAVHTPFAWCDIDEANPHKFDPPPGILWESSPGRFQGLWIFDRSLRPNRAQSVSKHLTYEFGGDINGWSVTKVLRIPGTFNHKREGKPPKVKLLAFDATPIDPKPLLKRAPRNNSVRKATGEGEFALDRDANALLMKHRKRIKHSKAWMLLRHRRVLVPDRSRQVFIMINGLIQAEVPWDDIACLIWHSPYFHSKHGTNVNALEAEIQRAMNKFEIGE